MNKKSDFLYHQLANELIAQIKAGVFLDAGLLPSEKELCETYSVSRTTVRQALRELSAQGYTKSIRGKGTVVVWGQLKQELNYIYSFDEDMKKIGRKPSTRIMDFVKVTASGTIRHILGLSGNESVYRIIRLRLANDEPMLLETNYLLCSRFPDLTQEMLEDKSLYKVLLDRYGFEASTAEETFEPVILRPMEAQLLHAESNALGLLVERTSFEGEKPIEVSKSVFPSSRFKYHVVLKR